MEKKYIATKEEIEWIKWVVTDILNLWQYPFIEGNDGEGSATAMSKETFFELLEKELS